MDRRQHRDRGFTISEFLLVAVVLAGLIGVVVWSVNGIDSRSAERECRDELRALKAASERLKAEAGFYPPTDQALDDAGYLELSESPNWKVVTLDDDDGPTYTPVGDRCR